jgi:hypothetical protein
MTLEQIVHLNKQCIYGLIDESNRKIYISFSKGLLTSLQRVLIDNPKFKHYSLKIFQDLSGDLNTDKLLVEIYKHQYKTRGYEIDRNSCLIRYRLSTEYVKIPNTSAKHLMGVIISTGNNNKQLIGLFDDKKDAKEFIEYINRNPIISPIYAINKYTSLCRSIKI